jgi:hypothetical protein
MERTRTCMKKWKIGIQLPTPNAVDILIPTTRLINHSIIDNISILLRT